TGTGTEMAPIEIPSLAGYSIAIAKRRGESVSTSAAYAAVTPREPQFNPAEVLALPPVEWRGKLVNDFEEGVFAALPATGALKQHFYDCGAVYSAMSGSGAAVFGIFDDEAAAGRAVSGLVDCDTFVGQFSF
ncbi:MAG: 4-(cytidine 5'-diphospho)-2-C-methyl-D-erythritol kinase, partial [Muribaculaceae bacterium]|nr:4-(cytidine 5'-diphospho)-2-C-methyl-D-erythritol kinase [Muribaculaceae bacterium]